MQVWYKGKLSNTFEILEMIYIAPRTERGVARTKGQKDALRTLLRKGLITRRQGFNPNTKRKVFYYMATKKGKNELMKARKHWSKTVRPVLM